jgi:chromosome partitioning protein
MEQWIVDHPRRLVVSSQKGGVAKTTTTLSLGASLAELGLSILLIDLDPQGHLTQALGVNPDDVRHTVGDVFLKQASLVEVSREGPVMNLDLIPSNRGLILVEKILQNSKDYEYRLRLSLDELNGRYYDLVIIDCPPSFSPVTVNALTAADLVITPIVCDYFSARSLQSYMRLLNTVRRNSNPEIHQRLLVTLYDRRLRLSNMMLEHYRQNYGRLLFDTIIPIDSKLRESPVFGRPITQYASHSRSAEQYRDLARELMTCLEVKI